MTNKKLIKSFKLDTNSIAQNGENRSFTVIGDRNAVFSLLIVNEDGHYYNFDTKKFAAASSKLSNIVLTTGSYTDYIQFPKIGDADHYDVYLTAELEHDTKHVPFSVAKYADGTIDFNSSIGSDSAILIKKIYQYTDLTLTLTAISPNSLTAFGSVSITTDTITLSRDKNNRKISFTVVATAAATRNFVIDRQPTENDVVAYVERTIGSAFTPVTGEDTSSSTYYRWPIDNIVGTKWYVF